MEDFAAAVGPPDGESGAALDRSGRLYVMRDGAGSPEWDFFDFNAVYAGYYPPCELTALAWVDGAYYLAGFDGKRPRLFSSLLGGVWEERSLVMRDPLAGEAEAEGRIRRILFDGLRGQIFLACASGDIITLPDCPKCVRVRRALNAGVADAVLEDGSIVLVLDDGGRFPVPLDEAASYRASFSYALERLSGGTGAAVDLRSSEEYRQGSLPRSFNVPAAAIPAWLEGRNREEPLFFLCRTGLQADDAVLLARRLGFSRSYSLGGVKGWAHVE
jgi:rhodanese-related sulfurtransferase